jgi:ADP-ribosylglycohydrolase
MRDSRDQSQRDRLDRAYQSLEGLCCGDAFGDKFFLAKEVAISLINQRSVPDPPWSFTDDTMMAISIVSTLEEHAMIDQDYLATSFAEHYDVERDYGPSIHVLLARIKEGRRWQEEAQVLFGGQGSFGNGSAMRVAPFRSLFCRRSRHARRASRTVCPDDALSSRSFSWSNCGGAGGGACVAIQRPKQTRD